MVNKVRGSIIDLPLITASKPTSTSYPAGTVAFNSAGTSPIGWKYDGANWLPFGSHYLEASTTWDPASISAAGYTSTTVTVTGAALGDYVDASFSLDITGCVLSAFVSNTNTVTAVLQNVTAGSINISSGTLRVRVERK